jgi:hypothetical protein
MILTQKQRRKSVELNIRTRYEFLLLYLPDFIQSCQNHTMEKVRLFWENWISACRKLKLGQHFSPCASVNLKWIKHHNMNHEASAGKCREYTVINRDNQ